MRLKQFEPENIPLYSYAKLIKYFGRYQMLIQAEASRLHEIVTDPAEDLVVIKRFAEAYPEAYYMLVQLALE